MICIYPSYETIAAQSDHYPFVEVYQFQNANVYQFTSAADKRTLLELNGIECYGFEDAGQPQKQVLCSRSFGHVIYTLDELMQAVTQFAERIFIVVA